jgi:choloylglycine hydrolase
MSNKTHVTRTIGGSGLIAFLAAMLFLANPDALRACSDVIVQGGLNDDVFISGRILDYDVDYPSDLIYAPSGLPWESTIPDHSKGAWWTGRYSFVAISIPKQTNKYLDGMNEHGLSAALLWQKGAVFSGAGEPDNTLEDADLVAWTLGKYMWVKDAIGGLKGMKVWHNSALLPREVHLVLHDFKGDSAVVEWAKGELKVTTDKDYRGVLTNEPEYHSQTDNLDLNYSGLNNEDKEENGIWIEGAGMLGMPGDFMSKSRFVRLYTLKKYALQRFHDAHIYVLPTFGPDWSVQTVFQLLGRVNIPMGTITHPDPTLGDVYPFSQWSLVRDHFRQRLYVRGCRNQVIRMVDLKKMVSWQRVKIETIGPVEPNAETADSAKDNTYLPAADQSWDNQNGTMSLAVTIPVRPEDEGSSGDMYVFARMNSGRTYYWNGKAWIHAGENMKILPCHQGKLSTRHFLVFKDEPADERWAGASIYAGYGENVAEMFLTGQYDRVVVIQ